MKEIVESMEPHLTQIFVANSVLIIIDAAIGYHVAPLLLQRRSAEEGAVSLTARGMRSLLSVMVGLYMFFNCLAYFDRYTSFLMVVSVLVLLDIMVQFLMRRRLAKGAGPAGPEQQS